MKVAAYARVSVAEEQDPAMQIHAMREWAQRHGHELVEYVDRASAADFVGRTAWKRLLTDAREHRFGHLVCWKLDRCFRSSLSALSTLEELEALGITFSCVTQAIDTSSASGRLTFQILAAVGEFERQLIKERTREGLKQARRNGRRLGRPTVASRPGFGADWKSVKADLDAGRLSKEAAAKRLGISRQSLYRLLEQVPQRRGRKPVSKRAPGPQLAANTPDRALKGGAGIGGIG